jgi:tRNA pseudouridine55 synthase
MRGETTDGVLLVDKPAGMTSHDVVLAARRAFDESRIGHAGTLDPFATGLLVLLLGRATRLLPHLDGIPKEYEATIALGRETDTDDLHGAVVAEAPPPSDAAIADAVTQLTGSL